MMVLWDTSPPSPWSAGFQNKVFSLSQHLISRFIVLLCGKQYKFGFGHIVVAPFLNLGQDHLHNVPADGDS